MVVHVTKGDAAVVACWIDNGCQRMTVPIFLLEAMRVCEALRVHEVLVRTDREEVARCREFSIVVDGQVVYQTTMRR